MNAIVVEARSLWEVARIVIPWWEAADAESFGYLIVAI